MFANSTFAAGNADRDRERICDALVGLIDEQGYSKTTLEGVLERAEVDRATFARSFPTLDDCFAEVWKTFTQTLAKPLLEAYWAEGTWRDGMRALGWELCSLILEDHLRARICMVEVNFGGDLVQGTRDLVLGGYVELVHLGRHECGAASDVSRVQAEGVVGAIWERAGKNVKAGDFDAVAEDVPEMLYLTFLPYLGPQAAQEEFRRGREELARFKRRV